MKCPYRDFKECLIEKCPSCIYEENTAPHTEVLGCPDSLSIEEAERRGYHLTIIKSMQKTYTFKSCKLIENNVQPIPSKTENITNMQKTSVVVNHSIF